MRWYLNPVRWKDVAVNARAIRKGGGARTLRLDGIGKPEGWVFPTSTIAIEVVAKDGTKRRFEPDVPVPWPVAYGYRAARKLGAPLISDHEPEEIELKVSRPLRSGS